MRFLDVSFARLSLFGIDLYGVFYVFKAMMEYGAGLRKRGWGLVIGVILVLSLSLLTFISLAFSRIFYFLGWWLLRIYALGGLVCVTVCRCM